MEMPFFIAKLLSFFVRKSTLIQHDPLAPSTGYYVTLYLIHGHIMKNMLYDEKQSKFILKRYPALGSLHWIILMHFGSHVKNPLLAVIFSSY